MSSRATRPPRLRDRVEYAAFRAVTAACLALGPGRAERAAERLGRAVYGRIGVRRDVVHANLRRAFPDRDEPWIRQTAEATYAHIAREAVMIARLPGLSAAAVRELTPTRGLETLEAAIAEGRGAVLAMGHFGNWELAPQALTSRGMAVDAVVQPQRNPLFDRAISETRERFGGHVIERHKAPRRALRSLRAGRAVVFVIDQNAGRSGIFVPYFGHPASTHRGAALLALRAGAPMFALRAIRVGSRYETLVERLPRPAERDPEQQVERLTAGFTAWLEAEVRRTPEQYFWLHKRWKTRPREEPPPP
ncbi:MAG: lysophospholipid acyltransferase family protein [Longimicrobiales bacterium]